jgi:hypothetical protein
MQPSVEMVITCGQVWPVPHLVMGYKKPRYLDKILSPMQLLPYRTRVFEMYNDLYYQWEYQFREGIGKERMVRSIHVGPRTGQVSVR